MGRSDLTCSISWTSLTSSLSLTEALPPDDDEEEGEEEEEVAEGDLAPPSDLSRFPRVIMVPKN